IRASMFHCETLALCELRNRKELTTVFIGLSDPPNTTVANFWKEISMVRAIRILSIIILAFSFALSVRSNAQNDHAAGAVFVMTNATDSNEIISYQRADDGSLRQRHRFATGGRGSGGTTDPLGSQGSLILTSNRSFLLAANAGSGEISVFRVRGAALE